MKAITPVIALVMLMLITVGMVGISYTWFSGMLSTSTEKTVVVPAGGIYCGKNKISAVIQNAGASSDITDNDIIFADVNGVNVKNSLFFGDFDRSGLVGYWRFEQSNGSAATNDSSGYGNTGTLTNMNLIGSATSGPTLDGRFGSALVFDGVNDYVQTLKNVGISGAGARTLEFWAKVNAVASDQSILGWGDAGQYRSFVPSIYFGHWFFWGQAYDWDTGIVPQTGIWQHHVVTFDGTKVRWWINGNQVGTGADLPLLSTTDSTFYMGRFVPGWFGYANVGLDEVQIWNRSLNADEIARLNRTGSGNFTIGPGQGKTIISNYPVFQPGKYTVRIGTRTNVVEAAVNCQ